MHSPISVCLHVCSLIGTLVQVLDFFKESLFRDLPEALCCVFKQDTLSAAYM